MQTLADLVELFSNNIKEYKHTSYKEARVRTDFIDKFFGLLGWDVSNERGKSEYQRDVVSEDTVVVKGKPRAPDYSFRVNGARKFFVEAKKPSVDIEHSRDPAFQVRRYAYTAKLPLSILTDFEELAVYDTRIKPDHKDDARIARIFYCKYTDYEHQWKYLSDTYSKEAILGGSFDAYTSNKKNLKGVSEVDKEFLKTIDGWRVELAKTIARNNTSLATYDINYAVQKLIDRIIFLRFAEDHNIEEYGSLKKFLETKERVYPQLDVFFKKADAKYNSSLFKPEEYISNLVIKDNVLHTIIRGLYYPKCPYEFSVLPIEVLGSIYEKFLGKTIRLTEGHQAKVEEKPEVRKAGGVYYTPQYIVDYIVENTIGEKLKNRKAAHYELQPPSKQKRGSIVEKLNNAEHSLTILDPACGSGSFLVRAYDYLLKWYLNQYTQKSVLKKNIKEHKIYEIKGNNYRLSIRTKQDILTRHLHGVDIDRQAVEVTKLSLLLKLMEGETEQTSAGFLRFDQAQLLPDLSQNIKCGNSLVGSDFYQDKNMTLFEPAEKIKINAFDWESEQGFSDIMKAGGFDCVIGNPPYIKIQTLQEFQPHIVTYLKNRYKSASEKNIDIYVVFIEHILPLLNSEGLSGYILPHKFFQAKMGENIRKILSSKQAVRQIVNFHAEQIFENATTYTCLLFLSNSKIKEFNYYKYSLNQNVESSLNNRSFSKVLSKSLDQDTWNFHTGLTQSIIDKINNQDVKLRDITHIRVGLQTSVDKIYVLKLNDKTDEDSNILTLYSQSLNKKIQIEKELIKPFLMGRDVKRYKQPEYKAYVIFPYTILEGKAELIDINTIKIKYPLGYEYLKENKKGLENRERGKFKKTWWQFGRPQNLESFTIPRIITPDISNSCKMTLSDGNIYHTTTVYSFVFKEELYNINFYLSLLNSKLLWFFLLNTGNILRGGFFRFTANYLTPFGIPKSTKTQESQLSELATQMLSTQKSLHETTSPIEKKSYQQEVEIIDKQIDALVYKLYELTDEEIKIVEDSG